MPDVSHDEADKCELCGSIHKCDCVELYHWTCSVCRTQLTKIKEGEEGVHLAKVEHKLHIDIERSKKDLYIEDDEIEEDVENRNVKMKRKICENCFVKILNESKTLGKLFLDKSRNIFIY
jgi:hypothetical protein